MSEVTCKPYQTHDKVTFYISPVHSKRKQGYYNLLSFSFCGKQYKYKHAGTESPFFFLEIMTYILSDNNEINSPTQIFANYHIRALHQDQDQTENVNEEVKLMTN